MKTEAMKLLCISPIQMWVNLYVSGIYREMMVVVMAMVGMSQWWVDQWYSGDRAE